MKSEKSAVLYKKYFKNFFPLIFLLIVWFIFSAPFFIQHKIPYPAAYQVNTLTPWNVYPQYKGPVKNYALSDVVVQIYPWKHFTIEMLKKGQLPLWNPYSFSGNPHLANYQSAVFSPFNLLFFIFSFKTAWSLLILFQPLLAGLFMFLFLREMKISIHGALIGSIAFMFCGFMVAWMAYGTLSMAIAFLPLALYAIERNFHKRNTWILLLLPLSLAISFFSGHFQTSVYMALYTLAFLLFKFYITKDSKRFLFVSLFFVIGIIISLIQIIPSLSLYHVAVRSELFSSKGGIPVQYLITLISPDFFGNPVTRNNWFGFYAEWASFIGVIPFMLALSAIFIKHNKRTILFFFLAGLISLLLGLDTPLQHLLSILKIPVLSTSIPSRIVVLFSFSFAVLAGFGFDQLVAQIEKREFRKILFPLLTIGLTLIFLTVLLLFFKPYPHDKTLLALRNLVLPSFLFFLASALLILNFIKKKKILILSLAWILVMLTLLDSLRFASKWMPFDPQNLVFPKAPVIEAMQKNIGEGRVFGDFGAYIDTYYHLPSLQGYDPLYSKRYGEFLASAKTGRFSDASRVEAKFEKRGKYADRVLDLLGVTLVYHPASFTFETWAYPVWVKPEKYAEIYNDGKFRLFHNRTALPHALLYYNYEVLSDSHKIIKRFYSDNFDFRKTLLLEENPSLQKCEKCKEGKAKIISNAPNKVTIETTSEKPALLFLSDNYYSQWKAKVNGKEKKIYIADYTFRSVVVPGGKSKVEFYYDGL